MDAGRAAAANGPATPAVRRIGPKSELDDLRMVCRRQASVIDTLGGAISSFRAGAVALKAENDDLRAENRRIRGRRGHRSRVREHADDAYRVETLLAADVQAPGAARALVAEELRERIAASVLERAQLLASELITNSICHSGAPADAQLVFRLELSRRGVRIEVQDPGRGGVIAPRPGDPGGGGGFGLNIVQTLSERWGLERIASGGTRVWAQIALAPAAAPA
jgi:serine/threonine-protein kinase RsbW